MGVLVCAASGFSFLVVLVCFQSPDQPIRSFAGLTSLMQISSLMLFLLFNCGVVLLVGLHVSQYS